MLDYYEMFRLILLGVGLFTMFTVLLFIFLPKFFMYVFTMVCQALYLIYALVLSVYFKNRMFFILFVSMTAVFAILNRLRIFRVKARISQLNRMIRVYKDDEDRCSKYKHELEVLTK